jgi:hypothetical protein
LHGDDTDEIPVEWFPTIEDAHAATTLTRAELYEGAAEYLERIAAQPRLSPETARVARRYSTCFRARSLRLAHSSTRPAGPLHRPNVQRGRRSRRRSSRCRARSPARPPGDSDPPLAGAGGAA